MADIEEQIADFHVRLGRLEQVVEVKSKLRKDTIFEDILEFFSVSCALALSYFGFGVPNH